MIERLKEKDDSLDGFLDKMEQLFIQTDGKEKYHHFFHKKENHDLQMPKRLPGSPSIPDKFLSLR